MYTAQEGISLNRDDAPNDEHPQLLQPPSAAEGYAYSYNISFSQVWGLPRFQLLTSPRNV